MGWATSTNLLVGLHSGRDTAWRRVSSHFYDPIFRFAREMGLGDADAFDCAQETLTSLLHTCAAGVYRREKGRFGDWLFGIARNKIIEQKRRLAVGCKHVRFVDDLNIHAERETWDRYFEPTLARVCVERVRQEVKPTTFWAFHRIVFDGAPARDVAEELGLSVDAVRMAKFRVMSRLKELRDEPLSEDMVGPRHRDLE